MPTKPKSIHTLIKELKIVVPDEAALLADEVATVNDFLKKFVEESTLINFTHKWSQNDCSQVYLDFTYVFKSEEYGLCRFTLEAGYNSKEPETGVQLIEKMKTPKPWEDLFLAESILDHVYDEDEDDDSDDE